MKASGFGGGIDHVASAQWRQPKAKTRGSAIAAARRQA